MLLLQETTWLKGMVQRLLYLVIQATMRSHIKGIMNWIKTELKETMLNEGNWSDKGGQGCIEIPKSSFVRW